MADSWPDNFRSARVDLEKYHIRPLVNFQTNHLPAAGGVYLVVEELHVTIAGQDNFSWNFLQSDKQKTPGQLVLGFLLRDRSDILQTQLCNIGLDILSRFI